MKGLNISNLTVLSDVHKNLYSGTKLLVYPRTNYTVYYAYGNGSIGYHNQNLSYGYLTIFENNTVYLETYEVQNYPDTFFMISAALLTLAWIFANFFGVYTAAYMKYHPNWIYFHTILSGGAAILTIIVGLIALNYSKVFLKLATQFDYSTNGIRFHITLGRILIALCFLQLATGTAIYIYIHIFKPKTGFIHKAKNVHKFFGYSITIISYLCGITGVFAILDYFQIV
jgi:hypothetical protein